MHFVYIIYSTKLNKYYKGYSLNPTKRLTQHNSGESRYTSSACDWRLVHVETFEDKSSALKRERVLKKYDHNQIQHLIDSPKNQLNLINQKKND